MPDSRPDMRHRALFVTSNAACRWNKMLLAELKVEGNRGASGEHVEKLTVGERFDFFLHPILFCRRFLHGK